MKKLELIYLFSQCCISHRELTGSKLKSARGLGTPMHIALSSLLVTCRITARERSSWFGSTTTPLRSIWPWIKANVLRVVYPCAVYEAKSELDGSA